MVLDQKDGIYNLETELSQSKNQNEMLQKENKSLAILVSSY